MKDHLCSAPEALFTLNKCKRRTYATKDINEEESNIELKYQNTKGV